MKYNFNLFIYHLFLEEWFHCKKKTSMAHEGDWNDCCCHHISLFADRYGANVRTAGVGRYRGFRYENMQTSSAYKQFQACGCNAVRN